MYTALNSILKQVWGMWANGEIFSGHPELLTMNLVCDYPEIEKLMVEEEWPFLRNDLELSHAQPKATAFIARKRGEFAGFLTTHNFGHIGYLDMMIITSQFRKAGIARPRH
jgi:hypothetical protein